MTSSSSDSELLDLQQGLPTTPADVLALRRVKQSRHLSTEDYLRALAHLHSLPPGVERPKRRAYGGEPFRLRD